MEKYKKRNRLVYEEAHCISQGSLVVSKIYSLWQFKPRGNVWKALRDLTESTRLESKTRKRRNEDHRGVPSGKNYSISWSGKCQRKSIWDTLLNLKSWESLTGQVWDRGFPLAGGKTRHLG